MSDACEVEVLREVESYPTTNMTRLFRYAGTILPESIGGGCLWMAACLARLLRARAPGLDVRHYDLGCPGSHTTTVSDAGRDRKLYEPSLFQVLPFSLTQLDKNENECLSDTFPLEGGYRLQLKFTWVRPGETLRMELVSPRGYTIREYKYLLHSPVAVAEADPYGGLPFLDQQDQIYLHVLNPNHTKSILTLGTRTQRMNVGRMSDRLFVESEPGFDSRFEQMAVRLQMTATQLRELLGQALEIHNGHYPIP